MVLLKYTEEVACRLLLAPSEPTVSSRFSAAHSSVMLLSMWGSPSNTALRALRRSAGSHAVRDWREETVEDSE